MQPRVISISQCTELGTLYEPAEAGDFLGRVQPTPQGLRQGQVPAAGRQFVTAGLQLWATGFEAARFVSSLDVVGLDEIKRCLEPSRIARSPKFASSIWTIRRYDRSVSDS